jgi:hypothetical protein
MQAVFNSKNHPNELYRSNAFERKYPCKYEDEVVKPIETIIFRKPNFEQCAQACYKNKDCKYFITGLDNFRHDCRLYEHSIE